MIVRNDIREGFTHLKPKTEKEIDDYFRAHPKKAIDHALNNDDVEMFKQMAKAGVNIGLDHIIRLDNIIKRGPKFEWGPTKIVKYLEYDSANIPLVGFKITDKTKEALDLISNLKILPYKGYPRGYKQYRVLKFIAESPGKVIRKDVTRLIFELSYGPGSFNPWENSGYWSANFGTTVWPYVSDNYVINKTGLKKLEELHDKFKDQNIKAYV